MTALPAPAKPQTGGPTGYPEMRDPNKGTDKAAKPKSLEDLAARLSRARRDGRPADRGLSAEAGEQRNALGVAWRISIELVVAIGVCGVIGFAFDRWLNTTPWLMLGFLILGFAAGMRGVWRTAQEIGAAAERDEQSKGDGGGTAGQ